MTEHGLYDRSHFAERIARNLKLAEEAQDLAIRNLHLEYVRLYRHLLEEQVPA